MHLPARSKVASVKRLVRTASAPALSASRVVPLSIFAGVLLSVGLGVGLAQAVPGGRSDLMPLSEVKPGMKGYGLTVFSGTKPERFDVEVISTLRNFRPHQDLVLIKTKHPRLDIAHTVAGMSGSPIYLNGKMIGAYAYGWLYGSEAIAGVTPIQSMMDELDRPLPKPIAPFGGSPLPSAAVTPAQPARPTASLFRGDPMHYDVLAHAKSLGERLAPAIAAPPGTTLARASTPILFGGVGATAMKLANDLLSPLGMEPLQAGGSSSGEPDPNAPTRYVDGGAIGVQMISGDISAMGLGTVTRVEGDKLVAFGHPMSNGGVSNLPTAIGKVHWILASQSRSFKIGEAVRPMGALVNDRQAAIVVDSKARAPQFPMRVDIRGTRGAPHPIWNMEIAHDPFMAPSATAMAIGNAMETTTAEMGDMTWIARSTVTVEKYGKVVLEDFNAGSGSPVSPDDFANGNLVRAVGALFNNPWEPVRIKSIDSVVSVDFQRNVSQLRGAKALESEISAGQAARIEIELKTYRGAIERQVIEVPVPAEFAGKTVEIELAPGYEVARPLATPNSVAELIASLPQQTFDPQSVVASYKLPESGAAFRGKVASRLPPGALDTLRSTTDSNSPETFTAQRYVVTKLKNFITGKDTVRVVVRPVVR